MTDAIETDYLVVGTGAAGMAFVDTLLTHSDADVLMVDRRQGCGGHWNDAYPFVRLHSPSTMYGVCSKEIDRFLDETVGCTAGEPERAGKSEILDYYDVVMRHHFIPSGRVRWLPMTEYRWEDHRSHFVRSLVSGEERRVVVRRKIVNATHSNVQVPSTHTPQFAVAPGVHCITVNDLPDIRRPYGFYTIVGSGKTGMDACLWLLEQGVVPARIRWIRPRDPWMIHRPDLTPGRFDASSQQVRNQFRAMLDATSVPDLFSRLEASGVLMRMDERIEPTVYRCATVSLAEIEQFRRVDDVVRLGRVVSIERDHIAFVQGRVMADADTLYVDCSAAGARTQPDLAVFDGTTVNLLLLMWCRPLFSAALTAFVESRVADEMEKNALCGVVPSPESPMSWLTMWDASFNNMARWRNNQVVADWLSGCRLEIMNALLRDQDMEDPKVKLFLKTIQEMVPKAAENLRRLLRSA